MLSLQIVVLAKGIGVMNDAYAYQAMFPEAKIVSADQANTFADVNLFLNNFVIAPHTWDMIQRARFNLFMVNDDLLKVTKENCHYFNEIDFFLCKTELAVKKLTVLKEKLSWKGELIYTKHATFADDLRFDLEKKDYSYFIHLAGQSPYKNTRAVLETWKQYRLPPLVMNCYRYCLQKFSESEWQNLGQYNVKFHNEQLLSPLIRQHQNTCGFHLCPSQMEGYGHYLNEARMVGAVIISVDAPPMNELVTEECAILIPYASTASNTDYTGTEGEGWIDPSGAITLPLERSLLPTDNILYQSWRKCLIRPADLYEGIQKALALSQQQRTEMGKIAFERYLDDSTFFKNQMLHLKRMLL